MKLNGQQRRVFEQIRSDPPAPELRDVYREAAVTVVAYHLGIPILHTTVRVDQGVYLGDCHIDGGTLFAELADIPTLDSTPEDDESWLFALGTAMYARRVPDDIWCGESIKSVPPRQSFLIFMLCLEWLLALKEREEVEQPGYLWSDAERSKRWRHWHGMLEHHAMTIVLASWDQIGHLAGRLADVKTLNAQ